MLPYREPAYSYSEPVVEDDVAVLCTWCGARGVAVRATIAECAQCGARFVVDRALAVPDASPAPPRPSQYMRRERRMVALAVITLVVAVAALCFTAAGLSRRYAEAEIAIALFTAAAGLRLRVLVRDVVIR
jgi:hypothetical protein